MNELTYTSFHFGHQLCPELTKGVRCFRSRRYREGEFLDVHHEHIPVRRMSHDAALEALRALIVCAAEWPSSFVLRSLLNSRPGSPERYPGFQHDVSYPETGVVRYVTSSGNYWSWFDLVVLPKSFRIGDA